MHSQDGEERCISKNTSHNIGSVFKCGWDKAKLRTYKLKEGMKIGMPPSSSTFPLQPIFALKVMGLLPEDQRAPEKSVAVGQVKEILVLSGQKLYWSVPYTITGKVASTGYVHPKSLKCSSPPLAETFWLQILLHCWFNKIHVPRAPFQCKVHDSKTLTVLQNSHRKSHFTTVLCYTCRSYTGKAGQMQPL